jgi:hypothetical protein
LIGDVSAHLLKRTRNVRRFRSAGFNEFAERFGLIIVVIRTTIVAAARPFIVARGPIVRFFLLFNLLPIDFGVCIRDQIVN